jgi:hypothetical protein
MTPGAQNNSVAEAIWYTGSDDEGRTITFELDSQTNQGIMGAILNNGHAITRRMAIITRQDPTVVTTNKYFAKYWDIPNETAIGEEFCVTNVWRYDGNGNAKDSSINIHRVGKLIKLWEFNVNSSLVKRYFSDEPRLVPDILWAHSSAIVFGESFDARVETGNPSAVADTQLVTDVRSFERDKWGIVGFPDPLYYKADVADFVDGPFNQVFTANIDYDLPGLVIEENAEPTGYEVDYRYERPVYLWDRKNHGDFYAKMQIGQPESGKYPPIDILLKSPIDSVDEKYMSIRSIGETGGTAGEGDPYVIVSGIDWHDLPQRGTIRFLTKNRNAVWKYDQKAFTDSPFGDIMLIGSEPLPESTEGTDGTVEPTIDELSLAVLLHDDHNTHCCRLEFMVEGDTVQLQFRVGILDMNEPYEFDVEGTDGIFDNLVKGFMPSSYSVSRWHVQNSAGSDPQNFVSFPGGNSSGTEVWNNLEILSRGEAIWIWWNGLLVTPDPIENAAILPAPVQNISNPYFDLAGDGLNIPGISEVGKVGFRLWPGAKIRSVRIYDQVVGFSEFAYGQLEITE